MYIFLETPDELKREQFLLTQEIQKEVDIPPILASRINQILPIRIQNIYEFNLSISGNNNSKLISKGIINPWDWFRETKPNPSDNNDSNKDDKNNGLVLKNVPVSTINLQKDKVYPLSFFDMNKYKKQEKESLTTYESHFDDFKVSDDLDLMRSLNVTTNIDKIHPPPPQFKNAFPSNTKMVPNGYNSFIDDKVIKPLNMQYNMVSGLTPPNSKPNLNPNPYMNSLINNNSPNPLKRKSFQ
ncbi:hypothetical protein PIROE2DRAFT_17068 [Piromyces sp. E2]|nr:hypothetical protein PIROE2DRAFT_17068 [Piromyces sp. E2]|eukprot:OUM57825.1 hypothetical protein PIROE2DRAFT_17068 [Piromyces sp. E2]